MQSWYIKRTLGRTTDYTCYYKPEDDFHVLPTAENRPGEDPTGGSLWIPFCLLRCYSLSTLSILQNHLTCSNSVGTDSVICFLT